MVLCPTCCHGTILTIIYPMSTYYFFSVCKHNTRFYIKIIVFSVDCLTAINHITILIIIIGIAMMFCPAISFFAIFFRIIYPVPLFNSFAFEHHTCIPIKEIIFFINCAISTYHLIIFIIIIDIFIFIFDKIAFLIIQFTDFFHRIFF